MANHGKLIQKFLWNSHFPGRHTGRFTGKLVLSIFFDWHIWYVAFDLDEFSSETACITPQNFSIDDWMSFPVKQLELENSSTWKLIQTKCYISYIVSVKKNDSSSRPGFSRYSWFFDEWVFQWNVLRKFPEICQSGLK